MDTISTASTPSKLWQTLLTTAAATIGAALLLWYSPLRRSLLPRKIRIKRLFLHPVKSCTPVEVQELVLDAHGFQNDRRWAMIDQKNEVVTVRTCPRLVFLRPEITKGPTATLALTAPGMERLEVPPAEGNGEVIEFDLWGVSGTARDCGPEAASWLQQFLGMGVRLAYLNGEAEGVRMRELCKQAQWNDGDESKSVYFPGSKLGFADSTQGTMISEASLDALNRRLPNKITMERFRMNIVLEGTRPYEEELWTSFGIGSKKFVVSRLCNRCTVTTVDPATGERGVEPLKELRAYHGIEKLRHADPRHGAAPILGIKFGTPCHEGTIRIGDEVEPLSLWKPGDRKY